MIPWQTSLKELDLLKIKEVLDYIQQWMKTQQLRVLAAITQSPHKSTQRLAAEIGVSQLSITRILKVNKWHPYKIADATTHQ